MDLFYKFCKKGITGVKILSVSRTDYITLCLFIVLCILIHQRTAVFYDLSKVRINMFVVLAVIFMVGRGYKYWIQVDNLYSKALNIVQLVPHTLKITAVKAAYIHSRRISAPVIDLIHWSSNINILTGLYIISGIAIAEAVHKNLVHHCALCPIRGMKAGCDLKIKLVCVLIR